MAAKKVPQIDHAELRRLAEERLGENAGTAHPPRTVAESLRLLHELEVHQIELEMQNEELRQAREKEAEALEKYADLYDFAPVGYFSLDRDGIISSANLTGAVLLGLDRSQLVGRCFGLFVTDTDRSAFTDFLRKIFESHAKEACEVTLKKGGKHPLFVQIEAIAAASGQECRVVISDITVRRQLEEKLKILHSELEAHASELEGANIELEAFNSTVAHDLHTPLTNINAYCQVMQQSVPSKMRNARDMSREYMKLPCEWPSS